MKKNIYSLLIIMMALSAKMQAQSFSLQNPVNYLQGNSGVFEYLGTVDVVNNSATDKDVKMKRIINDLAFGHESNFCWDICYPPGKDTCDTFLVIPAGGFRSDAIADLKPYGYSGLSRVTYCWYDFYNPSDSVCLEFVYDITTGIDEFTNPNADFLSLPHPNPADGNTLIIYHLRKQDGDARIVFYNVIGSKVLEEKLNVSKENIDVNTAEFQPGVYYYSLFSGGKVVSTNKLIVSHKN